MITSKNPVSVSVPCEGPARLNVNPCSNTEAGVLIMGRFKSTHGFTKFPEYRRWSKILERCLNTKAHNYKYYGGRGIAICDEWHTNFEAFRDYVIALPYYEKEGMTLDRINNDGNYEPGNLRWASKHVQAINRRVIKKTTSRYIGVSFYKTTNKWVAQIKNKKTKCIGYYKSEIEAATARDQYIIDNELWEYPLQVLTRPKK